MSTHAVAGDTHAAGVQLGESIEDSLGQFFGDVAVHVIAGVVRRLSGVDIEAGTGAKVVSIVLALDVQAAWNMG